MYYTKRNINVPVTENRDNWDKNEKDFILQPLIHLNIAEALKSRSWYTGVALL